MLFFIELEIFMLKPFGKEKKINIVGGLDLYENDKIKVALTANSHELETYEGKTAREVCDNIMNSGYSINASHNMYLGRELVRAEMLRDKYVQDYFD